MSDTKYNGWTNYETWRINLELCDDIASGLIGETTFDSAEALASYLEETVDEYLTGFGELKDDNLALQYARAFVNDVDWLKIAEHNEELIASDDDTELSA